MSRPPETPPRPSPTDPNPPVPGAALDTTGTSTEFPVSIQQPRRRFWLFEIWDESRETFKEFIKHAIYFGLIYGSLAGFHALGARSGLPQEQLEVLDKVHFYASLIALVIFSASFIIKVLIFEFRGRHNG
jgi:hypothetical protein